MKIREDFVTNSSSSSFIMAFNEKDDRLSYRYFKEYCMDLDYMNFYKLVQSFKKSKENTNKQKALELLRKCYSYDCRSELLEELIRKEDYEDYSEYLVARSELGLSDEFEAKIDEYLNNNEKYILKKKQIEDADLIVCGEIWDSNGGLLEWAIRNGFIENVFWRNNVMVWNVG